MPAELIEDFRHGLDARKFKLNSPAGTLTTLQNAHITPGGEAEKRKAFTAPALLPNCFGLEDTSAGLTTFGSNAMAFTATQLVSSGATTVFNVGFGFAVPVGTRITVGANSQGLVGTQVVTASTSSTVTIGLACGSGDGTYAETVSVSLLTFPGPASDAVSYQRLQHPDGSTAMTAVRHSEVYAGLAFVVAEFGAAVFAFYDGTLIYDFISGKAVASWLTTNQGLANHLAALINRSAAFSSSSATLVSGSDFKIVVTSPSGLSTEVTVEKDSAAGTLTNQTTRTQVDGISGVSAQGQFSIVAGTASAGVNKITSVLVGTAELLGAAVDYVTSNAATAAAVKDAINARQSTVPATTDRERTSNVAKLTIGAHKFIVGDIVTVAGVTNAVSGNYNGTQTITAKDATSISYANTGTNESGTSDTGGTVTMATRLYVAAVDEAVVHLRASATGTAVNDAVVSVTSAGNVAIDKYSFKLTMVSGATVTTIPTISSVFINGVDELAGAVSGAASLEAAIATAASQIVAAGNYLAVAVGNELFLSRKTTTSSSLPLSVMVIVNATGGVNTTSADTMIVMPGPENLTLFSGATSGVLVFTGSTALTVSVSGGTPGYSYLWEVNAGYSATAAGPGIARCEFLPDATEMQPQLKFTRNIATGPGHCDNFTGILKLTVTDSAGRKASAFLTVQAKFYPYTINA